MQLKPGLRLQSQACETQVMVVRAAADLDLRCGGAPMVGIDASSIQSGLTPGFDTGSQLGKRYVDEDLALEVLCTRAGKGTLAVGEKLLGLKEAKALPSSD